jgi:hypothetical protein
MRKLIFLSIVFGLGIALTSCDKSDDSFSAVEKNAPVKETVPAKSDEGVTPQIIPGANNGGNRTCAEVGDFFKDDPDYFDLCWDKVDFEDFETGFPYGLNVTVSGAYLSFNLDDCIMIGDKFYKVGAVIVKGGPSASVYFYEDGVLSDSDLHAPVNASGKPAGISNVTFCLLECDEQPHIVIAFKSYLDNSDWACTTGGPGNIGFVAYYDFDPGYIGNKIYLSANTTPASADMTKPVGNIIVSDVDSDGLWEVTVDNSDRTDLKFTDAYLFVGTLEVYNSSYYTGFPYKTGVITPVSTLTFELPF